MEEVLNRGVLQRIARLEMLSIICMEETLTGLWTGRGKGILKLLDTEIIVGKDTGGLTAADTDSVS